MKSWYTLFFFIFFSVFLLAQQNIQLVNPSFEGLPGAANIPKGWYDCGFQDETPCDTHLNGSFGVNTVPLHGATYIGLVVRDNETWEAVGQQLVSPLIEGQCYDFSLALARSPNYNSVSRSHNIPVNYSTPVRVRIWGGNNLCGDSELLGSSPMIIETSWQDYTFSFMPSASYSFLLIEAYYSEKPLVKEDTYNGNVLIDKASIIIGRTCTIRDTLIQQESRRADAGMAYSTIVSERVGTFEKTVRGITIKINPNQTVKSIVTALQKKFDEVNVLDDSTLSINVLIFSKEDRLDCKKKLKEAMKILKGTYKSYSSQVIVSK